MDGLTTSEYLQETARRNIEGEISIDEAQELIHNYYITKTAHDAGDAGKEEADRVSGNIAKLLSSNTLNFSVFGYTQVHRNIFNGVFEFAGMIRDYDISKKEWVLHGAAGGAMGAEEPIPLAKTEHSHPLGAVHTTHF